MSKPRRLREITARFDPRSWPLALRVIVLTALLSGVAIVAVGGYVSSVIADGLYEQRRIRVIEEVAGIRQDLSELLEQSAGASASQRQDALTAAVQDLRSTGEYNDRAAAIIPVGEASGLGAISSDRATLTYISDDIRESVHEDPGRLSTQSITVADPYGANWPGYAVGTRVNVAGLGSYDLYLVYSFEQEQRTLRLVQGVTLGGGVVLLALVVGIGVVIARVVTAPLHEAATAAEKMSEGDLSARMRVRGTDELGRLGTSFNHMADNLQQKVDDLTELSRLQHRFVSDVSHELRTPLTTIRMASSLLEGRREDLSEDLQRPVELLHTQVERFDHLLADLLEISRFDAGAAQLDAAKVRIDEVVESTMHDLSALAKTRKVELSWHPAGPEAEAIMDRRRIDRILRNLLTNAYEHGGGGSIRVDAAWDGESAVAVTVQDWGRGLSPQDARHVFDRFWRGDPSRARTLGGTGLGLSIAVEDARLHGGWLQAWGQEGEGAVFRLTLPLRPQAPLTSSPLTLERSFTCPVNEVLADSSDAHRDAPVTAASLPELSAAVQEVES